jgi:hypothetical protein
MQWIYGALLLRSVHPSDPTFNELVDKPILNVPIFTQLGSWECGNATLQNLCKNKACLNNQRIEEPSVGFQHQCYVFNTFKT